jgi:5-methylcytosine-specific restriction enzyme B
VTWFLLQKELTPASELVSLKGAIILTPTVIDSIINEKRKWITDKVYQYKSSTFKNYKNLFRPDTFSPTIIHDFILNEYLRLYPELKEIFEENNLKFYDRKNNTPATVAQSEVEAENLAEEIEPLNFWWLNANPKIWSISSHEEGQLQTYTTHNERGNKRRIYRYFEAAKPRDLIIGYESTPTKQIKAIYEVTKGIHNTDAGEEIEFQLIEKLEIPINWNDIKIIRLYVTEDMNNRR